MYNIYAAKESHLCNSRCQCKLKNSFLDNVTDRHIYILKTKNENGKSYYYY